MSEHYAVSVPTTVTINSRQHFAQPWAIQASATLTVFPAGWTPPPSLPPDDLGPCKNCVTQAGHPINLTNGNVWIQQRDYSNPGLGGGLELVRTWNSRLQDAGAPDVYGMFGHSWRSTYEERLSHPDANTVIYWRGDGSRWTFTYNSALGTYSLSSPPDERADLVHDPGTGTFTLTLADGTQRSFNSDDRLAAIVDRNGNESTLTYDASIRLVQVTDPAGRSLTFHYDNPNMIYRVTSMEDGVAVVANYTLDDARDLRQVTYADNSALNMVYAASSHMLTSVTDGDGKVLETHTYDSQHRGLASQRAYGADSVTVSYPVEGEAQLTDSMGNTTAYAYQTIGGRRFMTSIAGSGCASCGGRGDQSFTYDAQGNVASSTDALGRTTTYTYDTMGNVLSKSVQLDPSTTLTWSYTYNQFQQVLTATDPLGNVTTNTYDAKGNLLSTTTPPPAPGQPASTTSFAYDAQGQLTQVTDPLAHVTTMAYTPAGLIASITDAQSNSTTFTYDARGNRLSSTDTLGNATTYAYDAMSRLTGITQPGGISTGFAYDHRGRRTSVTDANGQTTGYGYDDADRLLSVTDAEASLTSYQYDTENHLASITDALGRVTAFGYDALGRVTSVSFPSSLSESYTYDAMGNLLTKTDRKGQAITYTYDNLDRLTRKEYPDSTAVDYVYDALSRLTQASDASGTYTFGYDNLGRLVATTTNYPFLSRTLAMSYSYDAASNRVSMADPEGGVSSYTYDNLNRLAGLTDFNGGAFNFSYDQLGRRTGLTRPNGVTTSYTYDNLSRLLQALHQKGSKLVESAAYAYDAVGNRTTKTELLQPVGPNPIQLVSNYSYDAIYELTQAVLNGATAETYSYDAVGNRLSSLGVSPYVYDESNQLTSTPLTGFSYDANGNTLSTTEGSGTTNYTWDFENRLTSVSLPGGGVVSFQYDSFGRRIRKVSASGTSVYVYDGDNQIEELNSSGGVVARYAQGLGIDEPLALYRSGKKYYYHADGLGSVVAMTDNHGTPKASYTYDAFGDYVQPEPPPPPSSVTNPFRYTGRELDPETGLYYYRARYYDPATGRFLSEDPLQFEAGTNFYRYVSNNPLVLRDPSGLDWRWWRRVKDWWNPKPAKPKPKAWPFSLCEPNEKPLFYDSSPWNPYNEQVHDKYLEWKGAFIDRCLAAKTPGKGTVSRCSTEPISYGGTAGFCYCCEFCEKGGK
jgi:RHS repeat-associated protein